jgi:LAO/AO transport system kinase
VLQGQKTSFVAAQDLLEIYYRDNVITRQRDNE